MFKLRTRIKHAQLTITNSLFLPRLDDVQALNFSIASKNILRAKGKSVKSFKKRGGVMFGGS